MRKIVLIPALAVILAACGNRPGGGENGPGGGGLLVISDRFFVQQIHDIWLNTSQYVGRTIQYEGIFRTVHWRTGGDDHIVIRYTISCCGEVPIGFYILLSDNFYPLPPENTWVEITGVVEIHGGTLLVRAVSLVETEDRGDGFVGSGW